MRIQPWENRVLRTDKGRLREIFGEVMVWIKIRNTGRDFPPMFSDSTLLLFER